MNDENLLIILSFTLPCLMTTLGAFLVFFFKKSSKLTSTITIGLAAGIMLSASFFSLLLPSLENAESQENHSLALLPVVLGFMFGAVFMILIELLSTKIFRRNTEKDKQKAFKLFTAITIHNIPEGLSVGFAVGTAIAFKNPTISALMFAVGIALQNFPEGLATALPLYNTLHKKTNAFVLGTISGLVEPLFAIAGFFLATKIALLLPWLLSFSAGAMIFVIIKEMIPEITEYDKPWGTWAFVLGFILMMILDIYL